MRLMYLAVASDRAKELDHIRVPGLLLFRRQRQNGNFALAPFKGGDQEPASASTINLHGSGICTYI